MTGDNFIGLMLLSMLLTLSLLMVWPGLIGGL